MRFPSLQFGARPGWRQVLVSLLVAGLGLWSAQALKQVDQDLRILYTDYTLAATDLAHVLADVMRYRNVILRALEAPTKKDFERITASLPQQRARIEAAVDRYEKAGLPTSRSGAEETKALQELRDSLKDYFDAASRTIYLLNQIWRARTPEAAAGLRHQAELQAADNAGPKLVQVSLAMDRLQERVAIIAKDMRDEGTATIRLTSLALTAGSFLLAFFSLLFGIPPARGDSSVELSSQQGGRVPSERALDLSRIK
jgi:hypothetical protein